VLDDALLNKTIDIAIHSLKDIPTQMERQLEICAILKRENPKDALVCRENLDFLKKKNAVIATSSNRRKALWLNKYPDHKIVDIRGNVPTRINKLNNSNWDATILACAGLIRLNLENEIALELDWMTGAPGQGAIAIMALKNNNSIKEIVKPISDQTSSICTQIERDFLNTLNGGCSSPVGAYAQIIDNKIVLNATVLSIDGSEKIEIELSEDINKSKNLGLKAAKIAIEKGGKKLIN